MNVGRGHIWKGRRSVDMRTHIHLLKVRLQLKLSVDLNVGELAFAQAVDTMNAVPTAAQWWRVCHCLSLAQLPLSGLISILFLVACPDCILLDWPKLAAALRGNREGGSIAAGHGTRTDRRIRRCCHDTRKAAKCRASDRVCHTTAA